MEPPDHTTMTKSGRQTVPPLTVADSAGKGKTSEAPPPPLKAWYLLGPRWGGAQDNESYGGVSIKTQKANMRKSEFLMLEELKSATHLNNIIDAFLTASK